MEKLPKLCVFCGKEPLSKTKEHVIPRWLMQITGDMKRKVRFQIFLPEGQERNREFAFDSFHFPACDSCNNSDSKLEADAKSVVEKLLSKSEIGQLDWVILLDWLDKVRIGIWLGTRYLDKNYVAVEPLFHIADRVGTKDRSLIIVRAKQGQRLSFFGSNSLAFRLMPSCFGLLINDIGLVNVSREFLLSRRLGFPFGTDARTEPSGLHSYVPAAGRERVMRPPLSFPAATFGTAIHQCIFKDWQNSTEPGLWETDYVRSNSWNHDEGLSVPFMENQSGAISVCSAKPSAEWVPKYVFESNKFSGQHLARICFDLQEKLWNTGQASIADKSERKNFVALERLLRNELRAMRTAIKDMQ